MSSPVIRAASLVLLCAGSAAAQKAAPPRSGAFITRLGVDTVAVERYTRTGDKLEGDVLLRYPRARVVHYVADLAPNGLIKAMTLNVRRVGADAASPPTTSITTMFADSTATIEVAQNGQRDTTTSGKKIFHGVAAPRVPTMPPSYAVYEQLLSTAKLPATDSVGYTLIAPGQEPAPIVWLARRGRDSVAFTSTFFGGWLEVGRVDAAGKLLGVNSTATTVKTIATRADNVDLDAIAKAWGASEASRGAAGQMSPPDTVRATVGAANVEVAYSRPLKRGRVIFGNVVPWDNVWRTGANAATQLTTSRDLVFGTTVLPAGKYTLWTLPTTNGAKLIINSQTGQWGTDYDMKRDVARLDLTTRTLAQPVDQFTIAVVPQGTGGVLRLSWDTNEYAIPFTIK